MSLLAILPKVTEYNRDKPSAFDETVQRQLTEQDYKQIGDIKADLGKLKLDYRVQLVIRGGSRQLFIRCLDNTRPIKPMAQKAFSLPDIHVKKA